MLSCRHLVSVCFRNKDWPWVQSLEIVSIILLWEECGGGVEGGKGLKLLWECLQWSGEEDGLGGTRLRGPGELQVWIKATRLAKNGPLILASDPCITLAISPHFCPFSTSIWWQLWVTDVQRLLEKVPHFGKEDS